MEDNRFTHRFKRLNDLEAQDGDVIVYWMQASQRAEGNHALEFAIDWANRLEKPLVVFFGITDSYPDANERHYAFMLQGLKETQIALKERGIPLVIRHQSPEQGIINFAQQACGVVVDRGYTRIQRVWREEVAGNIDCALYQVETDVVVPVEVASDKREYAARTIRPRIEKHLDTFLHPVENTHLHNQFSELHFDSFDISDVDAALGKLDIDRSVRPVDSFTGGTSRAREYLDHFIEKKLGDYDEKRNDPTADYLSHMSPYLQFGQISPIEIALRVREAGAESGGVEAYLEELIIRRELSMNFCYYDEDYDSINSIPDWAKNTLDDHINDERPYLYSREEFESGTTHDPYWNAAQLEMVHTGKMHGYMRMYWGKKILEWMEEPAEAFRLALELNNKYELDGRNPNGYAGVAWCFGNHDRGWPERPVFGKVRYMNANGLKRKFDADAYVRKVEGKTGMGIL